MRFSLAAISMLALAYASPVPVVEWVTLTAYKTVRLGSDGVATPVSDAATATVAASTAAIDATTAATTSTPETAATTSTPETAAATTSTPVTTASATSAAAGNSIATASPSTNDLATSTSSTAAASATGDYSGQGTYYTPGVGACGDTSVDTDYICALSYELFDQYTPNGNPNENTLCGKKITALYGGKTVDVTVVDRCTGCSYYDLDFSPTAFDQLADSLLGRIDITWDWA